MYSTAVQRLLIVIGVMVLVLTSAAVFAQLPCTCQLPDNGNGTVTMPPACPDGYEGPMTIIQGLIGATINIDAKLFDFQSVVEVPGGLLGGTRSTFSAAISMNMQGTGVLTGYQRFITLPVTGEIHWAARTSNAAVQTFAGDIFDLTADLFGDPDFDELHIRAGTNLGMPSPGSSTLTRQGGIGSDFAIDSFFDISYEIEFIGTIGSILNNQAGITHASSRIEICPGGTVPAPPVSWGVLKSMYQ